MKIATFNINNVNKRLANLLGWLQEARPDVACVQELKASDSEFPIAAFEKAGYGAVWRGERSWNGVAILARGCDPVVTNMALPGDLRDAQSRYVEAAVHGVLIGTLYAPNGNPQPGPKFEYKLLWMKRLLAHAAELFRERESFTLVECVRCGQTTTGEVCAFCKLRDQVKRGVRPADRVPHPEPVDPPAARGLISDLHAASEIHAS